MLNKTAKGAALLVAMIASGALLVAKASPEREARAVAPPVQPAAGKPFERLCKAGEAADTRPDPAWVSASYADDNCWAPTMPAAVNGIAASREQIVAGMAAAKRYIAASQAYQRCIGDFMIARKAQAEKGAKPLTVALAVIENHRIAASQRAGRRVDDQMRAAINAFNEYGSECPDQ